MDGWIEVEKISQVLSVLVVIATGMAVYAAAALLLRCDEWHEAIDAIRRRRKT